MQKSLTLISFLFSLLAVSVNAQVASTEADALFLQIDPVVSFKIPVPATHIPECTPPENVKVADIGSDNFEVTWEGPQAPEGGVTYAVRYKPMDQETWTEIRVKKGRLAQVEGLDNRKTYEVEVKKICPPVKNEPELSSEWVGVQDISLPSFRSISLPSFECWESYTPEPCRGIQVRISTRFISAVFPFWSIRCGRTMSRAMRTGLAMAGRPFLSETRWSGLNGAAISII
ncbi:MAG: fibronectin type III domain-containing protein [Saprospirales bacterium]|nr:fibronectin type III domain-containing protein [Saprospirales bacterium]